MSIDAKDAYLSNNYIYSKNPIGYNIRDKQGNISAQKFVNSFDYSLDSIKAQEIYEKVYRRKDFGFSVNGKSYTQHVINATFKYSVKEYNQIRKNIYVKNGYNYLDYVDKMHDGTYVEDGELLVIRTQTDISSPISNSILGKYFWFEDGVYKAKHNIKTVVGVEKLRKEIYCNGFTCDGIHYVRFKRSSGSSRTGRCLFINEKLYTMFHKNDLCGLKISEGDTVDLASLEAYMALTLSSIVDTCEIYPDEILLINDRESIFEDEMIAVTEDENHNLIAEHKTTTISNSLFDGQSLLDESVFEAFGYQDFGCLLLRNKFFKSCSFNTRIQTFFEDNGITKISQLNGKTLATDIKHIKLITTPSSIKYLKFGSFEQWLKNITPTFGIVKTEKETHFFDGRMVSSHYQLLNSLQLSRKETEQLLSQSLGYLSLLKAEPVVVRHHIKYPDNKEFVLPLTPLEAKNDIVYKLIGLNEKFSETKLYAEFRKDLTKSFVSNLKCGHLLLGGNYEILFGNPYEMIMESIGLFNGDGVLRVGEIHTHNFNWNTELLASRSPHVTMGNVWLIKNVSCFEIDKYFNLTPEIVCVNAIDDNIQERLSGADYDADTILLTDNFILIEAAKRNYDYFRVPTNLATASKTVYKYTASDKATLDHNTSENLIGQIINLSQELNSQIWDKMNSGKSYEEIESIYLDVAMLDVLSNIEIDSAKRRFDVNSKKEIAKIKEKYGLRDENNKPIKPKFFMHLSKKKGFYIAGKKKYRSHHTTMDYLFDVVSKADRKIREKTLRSFSYIFNEDLFDVRKIDYRQVNRVVELLRQYKQEADFIWKRSDIPETIKHRLSNDLRQENINYINGFNFNYSTMYKLVSLIDDTEYSDIKRTLFNILLGVPNQCFFDVIKQSADKLSFLVEVGGNRFDYQLYDFKYIKAKQ